METGFRTTVLLIFFTAICSIAGAQAFPTATQPLQLSAFGAATGTWTGLGGGRNLGVTAGVDIGWKPFHGFYPAIEGRGTYPIDGGQVDSQENALVGFKASRFYGRFHPYGDFLVGRDKIKYQNGGYPNPSHTLLYIDSVSNVFSYGGGLDLAMTDNLSLKVDAQLQHYGVPVTTSGHIYSTPVSIGVVYNFDFNHHIHYNADGQLKGYRAPPPPRSVPAQSANNNSAPDNAEMQPANTSNTGSASSNPTNSTPAAAPANTSNPANSDAAPSTSPAKPSPATPAPSAGQQPQ